tara:strand:+ start:13422 stop:13820 length:399 start_codon:yes stop_codon:yes gene_type:complete
MIRRLNFAFVALVVTCVSLMFILNGPEGRPWSNGFNNHFGCNTEDITDMYADYIEVWKQSIKQSFVAAEKEVLDVKPDDIVGPHPDPDKCICGGSGVITQGDGHKTACPYHGKKDNTMDKVLVEHGLIFVPL